MNQFDPLALAVPGVRSLKPYRPGKPIEELAREYAIHDAIKLASNENPRGAPEGAKAAIATALDSLHRYPDGNGYALKRGLAARLGLDTNQITLGNGSNDVLELVARAFAGPGDEVMLAAHAFAVYGLVSQAIGARTVVVDARNWGHDLEAMAAAVSPLTRVVFIANPNNPTGTWVSTSSLQRFLTATPRTTIVVVDEAYREYVDDNAYPDCVAWLDEFPNLVVTRTFSKVYGLAALRVGYSISSVQIANLLNRVRQPFNVNTLAQRAALAALDDADFVHASAAENRRERARVCEGFTRLGLEYIPSQGNFVSVNVNQNANQVYERMLHRGVIVRPIGEYGLPNHLRITVGLPPEIETMLDVLAASLTDD